MGRCSDVSIILCSPKFYVAKILFMFKEREELYSYISLLLSPNLCFFIFCAKELEKNLKNHSNFLLSKSTTQILLYLNELLQFLPDITVHSKHG